MIIDLKRIASMNIMSTLRRVRFSPILGLAGFLSATLDASADLDFGDAGNYAIYNQTYPVTLADDGARHVIVPGFHLGNLVDAEADGLTTTASFGFNGDDADNQDDEDGVIIGTLKQRGVGTITVMVTDTNGAGGFVDAWIDYDFSGNWETNEHIFGGVSRAVVAGTNVLEFNVPEQVNAGAAYMRVRLSRAGGLAPTGEAPDGEVEDHIGGTFEPPDTEITGRAYLDNNTNGVYDADEDTPFPGVVFLDRNNDGVRSSADPTVLADPTTGLYRISHPYLDLLGTVRLITDIRGQPIIVPTTDYASIPILNPTNGQPITALLPSKSSPQPAGGPVKNGQGPVEGPLTVRAISGAILYERGDPNNSYVCFEELEDQDGNTSYCKTTWQHNPRREREDPVFHRAFFSGIEGIPEGQHFTPTCIARTDSPGVVEIFGYTGTPPTIENTVVILDLNNCTLHKASLLPLTEEGRPVGSFTQIERVTANGNALLVRDVSFNDQDRVIDVEKNKTLAVLTKPATITRLLADIEQFGSGRYKVVAAELNQGIPQTTVFDIMEQPDGDPPSAPAGHPIQDDIPGMPGDAQQVGIDEDFNVVGNYLGNLNDGTYAGETFNGNSDMQATGIDAGTLSFWLGINLSDGFAQLPAFTHGQASVSPADGQMVDIPSGGSASDVDFAIEIQQPPTLDFGDAPDGPDEPNYPTTLARNGARHLLGNPPGIFLGRKVDADADIPERSATDIYAEKDDVIGVDDEDGVEFPGPLLPGENVDVVIIVSTSTRLDAWIDFNRDGDWDDAGEQIFDNEAVPQGTNLLSFAVPADALTGFFNPTYGRFRVSSQGNLNYDGIADDGEVEDYPIWVGTPAPLMIHPSDDAAEVFNVLRLYQGIFEYAPTLDGPWQPMPDAPNPLPVDTSAAKEGYYRAVPEESAP